jgi:pantoate--beta-alanine ligase
MSLRPSRRWPDRAKLQQSGCENVSRTGNELPTAPPETPRVLSARRDVRRLVIEAQRQGKSVGLVPTMGALHAGHLSLVEAAASEADVCVVTIFVNPTQFLQGEDFERYPRDLKADLQALSGLGVDYVFAPSIGEMLPPGHSTFIEPPEVARPLEGRCRPGHFRGVATIVLKLLHVIPADIAYFGHKDYQQTLVIRRMVEDLDLTTTIRVCPTVRELDGLALSSRNAYLDPGEREQALALSRSLSLAADRVQQGQRDAAEIVSLVRQELAAAGIHKIDYVALVHPETLAEVRRVDQPTLAAVAAVVGSVRLIDNRLVG